MSPGVRLLFSYVYGYYDNIIACCWLPVIYWPDVLSALLLCLHTTEKNDIIIIHNTIIYFINIILLYMCINLRAFVHEQANMLSSS